MAKKKRSKSPTKMQEDTDDTVDNNDEVVAEKESNKLTSSPVLNTPLKYTKPKKNDNFNSQERKASGIYSQLSQDQISVLRDAFSLIDHDNDGIISDEDLVQGFKLINKEVTEEKRAQMFSEVQNPLAFGGFLSALAGKMGDLSNKEEIMSAFEVFSVGPVNRDKKEELRCDAGELRESLIMAGMASEDINMAMKSFIKTEMNGNDVFLAERFVNTVRDD